MGPDTTSAPKVNGDLLNKPGISNAVNLLSCYAYILSIAISLLWFGDVVEVWKDESANFSLADN